MSQVAQREVRAPAETGLAELHPRREGDSDSAEAAGQPEAAAVRGAGRAQRDHPGLVDESAPRYGQAQGQQAQVPLQGEI